MNKEKKEKLKFQNIWKKERKKEGNKVLKKEKHENYIFKFVNLIWLIWEVCLMHLPSACAIQIKLCDMRITSKPSVAISNKQNRYFFLLLLKPYLKKSLINTI